MNTDQKAAFEAVQAGKNLFLTGPAGTGKSFLISNIVAWAESNHISIAATALTGCAALLLGPKAKTLHSWAGIGLGRESAEQLAATIMKHPRTKRRWKSTQILVIDEISMMTPELFEKLDFIGKKVRSSTKPWGGLQLVLCGDFLQLPPVVKGISGEIVVPGRFAFESPLWREARLVPAVLTKIERQTDKEFQQLLNECRIGEPSARTVELLKARQGLDWKTRLIRPTLLFSRNADVDAINEKNIAALKQPIRVFEARTEIVPDPADPSIEIPTGEQLERFVQRLDNDANYCPHLELCVGAQVMLLTNKDLEAGLANGSRGVVVNFRGDGVPLVQFLRGDPIPIEAETWKSNDCPILHRLQIPLRVAYAITIHKSQGATLDCALVDIGTSTFEFGQAYVALSRVRDMESLYIWNLDTSKIKAHPTVTNFYRELLESPAVPENILVSAAEKPSTFGTDLPEDWRAVVRPWAESEKGAACLRAVDERGASVRVFPPREDILTALRLTSLRDVKVILLGQDPYHGAGQAHGLSFSVRAGTTIPPTLKNIRKEFLADLALPDSAWPVATGDLSLWARQGVLMLNTTLTVEEGNAASHAGLGWEDLTMRLLNAAIAAHAADPLVFLAWGKHAQGVLYKLRLGPKHQIFPAVHPSPLSAHAGFFGSKPFSKVNAFLTSEGVPVIEWALSPVASVVPEEDPK